MGFLTNLGMGVAKRKRVEVPVLRPIEVFEDPSYDWYLTIGAALVNMFRAKKALAQDDIDNPIPALEDIVVEDLRHPNGELIGRCRMTYLEKLTIWDFMDYKTKKLQVKPPANPNHIEKTILPDGSEVYTNREGYSYAAKETAKDIYRRMNNEKLQAQDRVRRERNKRKS